MIEGCGYTAISLRVKGINLLVASLYLKCDTPLHCPPNSTIMSSVAAVAADHVGQWIIAGGCNVSPTELADCSFARQIGGHVMSVGEPTTHSGGELHYALVSAGLSEHAKLSLDWQAPHRPHASLLTELRLQGQQARVHRLEEYQIKDAYHLVRSRSASRPTHSSGPRLHMRSSLRRLRCIHS